MWFLYIAKFSTGKLYTGITLNVNRRIKQHNNGTGAKSLKGKGPVRLVYTESFRTGTEARKREYAIKQWNRESKLKLIHNKKKGLP